MHTITVYETATCPYCHTTKEFLTALKQQHPELLVNYVNVGQNPTAWQQVPGTTVPQIYLNDIHIGGWSQLSALAGNGKLDAFLQTGELPTTRKSGWLSKWRK